MQKISWEWIAGFVEGEGHIQWLEGNSKTRQGTSGRIIIGQKDKRPLEAIKTFLLKHGINSLLYVRKPSTGKYPAALWILTIQRRNDVISFLEKINPFLFQKEEKGIYVYKRLKSLVDARNEIMQKALALKESGLNWYQISRRLKVGRQGLVNRARAMGIETRVIAKFKNENDWRQDRVDRGLCEKCGNSIDKNGTKRKCRSCADKYNRWRNAYRKEHGRTDR